MAEPYKNREALLKEIEELKAAQAAPQEPVSAQIPEEPVEVVAPVPTNEIPVPADWNEAVKTILNDKFKVEVDYSADSPTFGFSILVPQEYSNASKPHWETYHEDRRTRVINNADGVGGVKQWVERVYNNFDQETKAKITSDRNLQNA